MKKLRGLKKIKFREYTIEVYPDLSTPMLDFSMKKICAILNRENMEYNWGYTSFMKIKYQGIYYRVETYEEALTKLKTLGIID